MFCFSFFEIGLSWGVFLFVCVFVCLFVCLLCPCVCLLYCMVGCLYLCLFAFSCSCLLFYFHVFPCSIAFFFVSLCLFAFFVFACLLHFVFVSGQNGRSRSSTPRLEQAHPAVPQWLQHRAQHGPERSHFEAAAAVVYVCLFICVFVYCLSLFVCLFV